VFSETTRTFYNESSCSFFLTRKHRQPDERTLVDLLLSDLEVRVLGVLIEKEITTPDYYPLSLNALTNACNQKSNRNPVIAVQEEDVQQTLESLAEKSLAGPSSATESRVAKFSHRAPDVFNFDRREIAVMCELMLRGPQTPGELRAHAERMYRFDDLESLELTLARLSERQPALVKRLTRLPGTKESRYAQLLAGEKPEWTLLVEPSARTASQPADDRLLRLEAEVAGLHRKFEEFQQRFAEFRKQFEP
jgi:uncharacterized protein YceH (UPF0502 family)